MATIFKVLNRFKALDTDAIAVQVIEASVDTMADLNAEQIDSGLKANGEVMPDYSQASVEFYGKQPGPIRLRDTGAFQAGFFVTIKGGKVVFDSSDKKRDMLINGDTAFTKEFGRTGLEVGYGEEVFGLSEKYKLEAMREAVRPEFIKKMEVATGLKFK